MPLSLQLIHRITVSLIILALLFIFEAQTDSQIFNSLHEVKSLYNAEADIVGDLEMYIQQELRKIEKVQKRVEEIRSRKAGYFRNDVNQVVAHPINTFNMIKQWWNPVTPTPPGMELPKERLRQRKIRVPREEDYNAALEALLRLQQTYKLTTADLMEGEINGVKPQTLLEPFDFWALGFKASLLGEFGLAILWLETVVEVEPNHVPMGEALGMLAHAYSMIGNFEKAADMAVKMHQLDPGNIDTESRKEYFIAERDLKRSEGHQPQFTALNWRKPLLEPWRPVYEELCRGDSPIQKTADLMCRNKEGVLPYVVYKQEILSHDPYISMFYEVATDKQIETMKNTADITMKREFSTGSGSREGVSVYDIAEGVREMTRKISDITGLSAKHRAVKTDAEPYQVKQFGVGENDTPTYDYLASKLKHEKSISLRGTGDRIATFALYLSETTAGGATVFPDLGVRIPPIKGAAAFWFNLSRSGRRDVRTANIECPVLLGQKWVAKKWIREHGQTFRRKCCAIDSVREIDAETECF